MAMAAVRAVQYQQCQTHPKRRLMSSHLRLRLGLHLPLPLLSRPGAWSRGGVGFCPAQRFIGREGDVSLSVSLLCLLRWRRRDGRGDISTVLYCIMLRCPVHQIPLQRIMEASSTLDIACFFLLSVVTVLFLFLPFHSSCWQYDKNIFDCWARCPFAANKRYTEPALQKEERS